jgi:hypothetical protein
MDLKALAKEALDVAKATPAWPPAEVISSHVAGRVIEECVREIRALQTSAVIDPDILKEKICARLIQLAASLRHP